MSTDLVLRTIGTLACIYMVGLFVSAMSVSAISNIRSVLDMVPELPLEPGENISLGL